VKRLIRWINRSAQRDQSGDLHQLEEEVYRSAADRDEAADEGRGGPDAGSGDVAGCHPAKDLKPGRLRELVRGVCSDWAVWIRQTCGAIGFDRATFHYQSRRTDQAAVAKRIRVDHGNAPVARDMDLWADQRGVMLDFSRPGKPTDNAFIETFNGRFRAECLNQHWFLNLADAAEKLEAWHRCDNAERPDGAIGNKVPILMTKTGGITSLSP
jgi:putative transposase